MRLSCGWGRSPAVTFRRGKGSSCIAALCGKLGRSRCTGGRSRSPLCPDERLWSACSSRNVRTCKCTLLLALRLSSRWICWYSGPWATHMTFLCVRLPSRRWVWRSNNALGSHYQRTCHGAVFYWAFLELFRSPEAHHYPMVYWSRFSFSFSLL